MSGLHEWEQVPSAKLKIRVNEGYHQFLCKRCGDSTVLKRMPRADRAIERWTGGFEPIYIGCNETIVEKIMTT